MFAQSPFQNKVDEGIKVSTSADIIFVADMFVEDYVGGAELTTEALIESSPFNIQKIHSRDVTMEMLESGVEKYWIFGNYSSLDVNLYPSIVGNLDYSILEYDYKYCTWRSPDKHASIDGTPCDCELSDHGKMVSALMYGAKSIWWMSEKQQEHYHSLFPFLEERENVVLSSVFGESFFRKLKELREVSGDRDGWVVLGSQSWVKGFENSRDWCIQNDKKYEIVWDMPYEVVLEKLSKAEGFVYLPRGGDTCPRMVIEAKLLGCRLHLNDNVQHKDEIWFNTDDLYDTEAYLYAARERFWGSIKNSMNWHPTISGYTTTLNCITHNYPWKECIKSMLGFCNEVIVVDGGSDDGTWDTLQKWSEEESRLKVHKKERNWDHPRFAVFDGAQKAHARSLCSSEFCWQQDADEVVHEDDYNKVINLCRSFPNVVDLVSLPVVEYWGGKEKVRIDVNPWKWRLSRNTPGITHGIPKDMRKYDENGDLYASIGTDGCDYVDKDSFEVVDHASFYISDAHNLRMHALAGNSEATGMYQEWITRNLEMLPSVHHYSWFDLTRKIKTYRDYWSKHWQSLYDISQEDTAENNMFFDKPWSEVTEDDITDLANNLKEKMGGWVFHQKVDFSKPTPHITIDIEHPEVINEWITD